MKPLHREKKPVGDLHYTDFVVNPVWTWADDDEDESLVVPLTCSEVLDDQEEHDALFVAWTFTLQDGTQLPGVLSVRLSNRFVYLLSFVDDDKFFDHPLLLGDVTREQVADWLQKPLTHVFPIIYSTPFAFRNGQPLIGKVQ